MADTYTQIHIQIVFAVKFRYCAMKKSWRDNLFKYITGIVHAQGQKLLCINGVEDHVHILIGLRPTMAISALVQEIKKASSKWINDQRLVIGRFSWQEGFAAFSYSPEALPNVIRYIENQEQHHHKSTFAEEVTSLLNEFKVDFNPKYVLKDPSD
jgi:putative transposase